MPRRVLLLALAVTGCDAGPGEPRPFVVNVASMQVFAGDSVFVRSAQFRAVADSQIDVRLADSLQLDLPVRRVDDTTVVFDAPAVLTGSYAFRVELLGGGASADTFVLALAGVARLEQLGKVRGAANMLPFGDGRVIYHGQQAGNSPQVGPAYYVVLDPVDASDWISAADTGWVNHTMYAPGPSYRAGHVVVDFAAATAGGAADPAVWSVDAAGRTMARVRSLPCGEPGWLSYTAAELSDSVCVWMTYPDSLMRNGSTPILTDRGLFGAQFRMAPGGARTVIVMGDERAGEFEGDWPVLDAAGRIAWTWPRYGRVMDAAFTPGGDTLFVVGRGKGTDSTWTLDTFASASGTLIASDTFPSVSLSAVLIDPVRDRLYVAMTRGGPGSRRHSLLVLERSSRRRLASIPAPFLDIRRQAVLASGRGTGRVHLLLISAADPIINVVFDVP